MWHNIQDGFYYDKIFLSAKVFFEHYSRYYPIYVNDKYLICIKYVFKTDLNYKNGLIFIRFSLFDILIGLYYNGQSQIFG